MVVAASTLDNPSFVRSVYAQCLACVLHLISSTLWVVSLSSAYWSRGSYSFLLSRDAVHTVGVWKTCVTYIEYEPYSKTWLRKDGACWATSRYLFDSRIEVSSILSFVSCMWIAVIMALNGLLYTAKSWRPFIRQFALPGSKLCQMLIGLAMILVFSEATDVSYNVRLWARHLAMATIVFQAAEVLFLLCVGLSYKTWQRGVRDLCADVSLYIAGAAHQPPPPRSTVIMNSSCREDHPLPRLPNMDREVPAPHEMTEFSKPEVEVRALKWENTRQADQVMNNRDKVSPQQRKQEHIVLDIENPIDEEEPVAFYTSSPGCRLGKYPKPLRYVFGRPRQDNHRNVPGTSSPPTLDQIMNSLESLPDPPETIHNRNSYSPQEEERSCVSNRRSDNSEMTPARSHSQSTATHTSDSRTSSNVSMKGRRLPPIPGSDDFIPTPKKISDEIVKNQKRRPRQREVRIVEKDLRGMFKEISSRV